MSMKERIDSVLERVRNAAARVGRDPSEIKLVAVTKRFPPGVVEEAVGHGLRVFGENYVQEAVSKIEALRERGYGLEWHFIGHLQKNKARKAVEYFDWIETVDSMALMKRLMRVAREVQKETDVLIQVNISEDPGKAGLMPNEVLPFFRELMAMDAGPVRIQGLMTITRFVASPREAREWFKDLRLLRDHVVEQLGGSIALPHLSMGMSNDFEVAIEEGATIVRVGQALFGPRPTPKTRGELNV